MPRLIRFKPTYILASSLFVGFLLYLIFAQYLNYAQSIPENNVKAFYKITKTDPLFYDSAMDVEFLRESVKEMQHVDDLILYVDSLYRPSEPEKYRDVFPEGWRLWPDEFLATLPFIHEATTGFLNSPSQGAALNLLLWYEQAIFYYKYAIDLHLESLNEILRRDSKAANITIVFVGSGTTPEIVRDDFLLIQKNAEVLKDEIAMRKKCLFRGQCQISNVNGQWSMSNGRVSEVVPFKPLSPDILGINPEDINGAEPYFVATPCFGLSDDGRSLRHPFYIKRSHTEDTSQPLLIPILTNIKYYIDYTKVSNKEGAAQLNLSAGITLKPHWDTADYVCTDLTYLPRLIKTYLEKEKSTLGGSLLNGGVFATLPYLMQNTARVNARLIYRPLYTKKAWQPLNLLITRSGYSIYFGTFSPAVWRIEEKPQFLLTKNFDSRPVYTTHEELLLRGFTHEEIVQLNNLPTTPRLYQDALSEISD